MKLIFQPDIKGNLRAELLEEIDSFTANSNDALFLLQVLREAKYAQQTGTQYEMLHGLVSLRKESERAR